jgi:hypothetical protein
MPGYPRFVSDDDLVNVWSSLPRRIYLDTSTLQTIYDFGGGDLGERTLRSS